jgi:hypothetical protein
MYSIFLLLHNQEGSVSHIASNQQGAFPSGNGLFLEELTYNPEKNGRTYQH